MPSTIRNRALGAWGWKREGDKWVKARTNALDPITLHEARHTAVSVMVASGADRATLLGWVGHSDLKMLDHYTRAVKQRQANAIEAINAYMAE